MVTVLKAVSWLLLVWVTVESLESVSVRLKLPVMLLPVWVRLVLSRAVVVTALVLKVVVRLWYVSFLTVTGPSTLVWVRVKSPVTLLPFWLRALRPPSLVVAVLVRLWLVTVCVLSEPKVSV